MMNEGVSSRGMDGWVLLLQSISLGAMGLLAGLLSGLTALAILGIAPWLRIDLGYGQMDLPYAGILLQLALTLFAIALAFYLPANRRIMALEASHRDFHIAMDDVARAYRAAHEADRAGVFQMHSEFDSVRERFAFLRNHPDLGGLEPGITELAAQMSVEAGDLARIYSDENVDRARAFLTHRQHEIVSVETVLEEVREKNRDLTEWSNRLNAEDVVQKRKMAQLEDELLALLPKLGFETEIETRPAKPQNVVPISKHQTGGS